MFFCLTRTFNDFCLVKWVFFFFFSVQYGYKQRGLLIFQPLTHLLLPGLSFIVFSHVIMPHISFFLWVKDFNWSPRRRFVRQTRAFVRHPDIFPLRNTTGVQLGYEKRSLAKQRKERRRCKIILDSDAKRTFFMLFFFPSICSKPWGGGKKIPATLGGKNRNSCELEEGL